MPGGSKTRNPKSQGTAFMVALFLIFALAGGGMFSLTSLRPVQLVIEATSWEPVAGVIDSSRVAVSPSHDGRSAPLAVLWSSRRRKTRASAAVPSGKDGVGGQGLELKAPIPPTLTGRRGCAVTASLIVIIISFWQPAGVHPMAIIFLFIACVFLALWMGHSAYEGFRALSCLRPRVVLDSTHLAPGSVSQAHWQLVGRVEHVYSIAIRLEGREVATYSRGSTLTTDHRVFHSELLVSEHWPEPRQEGVVTLRIPEHTVPSFAAPNNKIEWLLIVTGETKFINTPDIEFPITVRPPQGGKPSEETRR